MKLTLALAFLCSSAFAQESATIAPEPIVIEVITPYVPSTVPSFQPAPSLSLGRDFRLAFNTSLDDTYVVGSYDMVNKQVLAGYGREFFQLYKGEKKLVYLSGRHLFNADRAGRGMVGAALGTDIGALGEKVASLSGRIGEVTPVPEWLSKVSHWVSIEVGGGYWLDKNEGARLSYDFGGRVDIPLDLLWSLTSGKK